MRESRAAMCLCAKEVAEYLGVSERSALRLMADGRIKSFRVGRLWRTTEDAITRFVTGEPARETKDLAVL